MSLKWLPNLITLLRIVAAPVIAYFLWNALGTTDTELKVLFAHLAFLTFTVAALTDWVDGLLARALNAASELGAKLDLWADKIIVFAVLIAIFPAYPEFSIIGLICLSLRDILVMRLRAKRPDVNLKATVLAKSKTAIVMTGMALAMLGYYLAVKAIAAAQGDLSAATQPLIIARLGASLYVFGCVLSLGTGFEYFAAAAKNRQDGH